MNSTPARSLKGITLKNGWKVIDFEEEYIGRMPRLNGDPTYCLTKKKSFVSK